MNFNKFFKKRNKPDSDGTLAANEEISYQPLCRSNSHDPQQQQLQQQQQQQHHQPLHHVKKTELSYRPSLQLPPQMMAPSCTMTTAETCGFPNNSYISNESVASIREFDINDINNKKLLTSLNNSNNSGSNHRLFEQKTIIIPTISSNSPRSQKKLIKPGCTDASQPAYLMTNPKECSRVHISDEYTDPFDNIDSTSNIVESCGYIEPYKAQKLFGGDTSQNQRQKPRAKEMSRTVVEQHQNKLYDDPWDHAKKKIPNRPNFATDYDEPWDNNVNSSNENLKTKLPGGVHGGGGNFKQDSLDSQSPASSRSSLNKPHNRLVKVDSPRLSPRTSPRLDRRLIKPSNANNIERSPPRFDGRLVKAEPSLEELRQKSSARNSSRGSSGINSPLDCSPSHSPAGTLSAGLLGRLASELQRSQSPLSHNSQHLSKIKSRSLDLRNKQQHLMKNNSKIPKSASDDQLVQHHQLSALLASNQSSLGGVVEYEEPWDNHHNNAELLPVGPIKSHIVHSRSRSYEINVRPSLLVSVHEKSNSLDKTPHNNNQAGGSGGANGDQSLYEKPWDKDKSIVPEDHLKSMQRFQQRKLELHPSEAIDYHDLNPQNSLSKQSWFHGSVTREIAEYRLQRAKEGSYLVRNSESIPNNFSLSLRILCGTIHMVISQRRDGFWILGEFSAPFRSVSEMIDYYSTHRLKISDSNFTNLRYPVDRSRF